MKRILFKGLLFAFLAMPASAAIPAGTVTVRVDPCPVSSFRPADAFGACVDGLEQGDVSRVYTPANIDAMSRIGYGTLSYRLRTELAIEAWHWSPKGVWSDAPRHQGYWTSRASPALPIMASYGYRLPRRGSTIDQANDDGYSRMDDGDRRTFWKSNPYLDKFFTGEDNFRHPQWVVIDLGRARPVNAIRIGWAVPFAVHYAVQYWTGEDTHDNDLDQTFSAAGAWRGFPAGTVTNGKGGDAVLRLCPVPVTVRFVRFWLTGGIAPRVPPPADPRDTAGYAIREISVGRVSRSGRFQDWVRHAPRHAAQTTIYASSTDPWHDAACRDSRVEQPGFDRVFRSALTRGRPVLIPVGVLYDTPDNAAAEVRCLLGQGYALRGVEMGEEPDGQYATPEDYGALYVQFADALHRVSPRLPLGGPGFQTNVDAWECWPDARGNRSWLNRFLRYLARRGRIRDFGFLSFEWYPFDDVCAPPTPQLMQEPQMLAHTLAELRRDGLPRATPCLMTEYGYSSFAAQSEMDLPGALLNAEIAAQFLTLGGTTAYLYGLEPNAPMREAAACATWGNLAVFLSTDTGRIRQPLAAYWSERMLTQCWAQPQGNGKHQIFTTVYSPAISSPADRNSQKQLSAYAVLRPDKYWAVMLLNKDPHRSCRVRLRFLDTLMKTGIAVRGPTLLFQFGHAQYRWHARQAQGFAAPNLPPAQTVLPATALNAVLLPPQSLSVVRCRLAR